MNPDSLVQAGRRLEGWARTMILSHDRPDGDALGGLAAMARVITSAGRQATPFVYGEIPARFGFLADGPPFTRWADEDPARRDAHFDGILILDTCSWAQVEPAAEYLRASRLPRLVIDHHATRDDLAGSGGEALYVIDPTAGSACGMLFEWCAAMNWHLDAPAREALFTGMATDTGWFRFSNTDARTLRAAAELVERGVRPEVMHARCIASYSAARLRLMGEMLGTLELHEGEALAVMHLTKAMFERCGADPSDTEDLVNEPMGVATVAATVLLTDYGDGRVRVNFRSKSPEVCGRDVDVAVLARQFGGGGHRRAAGARVAGTLDDVRQKVTAAMRAALRGGEKER